MAATRSGRRGRQGQDASAGYVRYRTEQAWACAYSAFPAGERLEIAPADRGAFMPRRFEISRASPQMRNFAVRLISYEEASGNGSSETTNPEAFPIYEKLRPRLAALMGNGGCRALLARALVLANAEVPWLRTVHVETDGSMECLDGPLARLDPESLLKGRVVLLAQLLGLLVALIGQSLTLHLVREVWPKAPLDDLDFGKGVRDEKAK